MTQRAISIFLIVVGAAYGQLTTNSVTVTATRNAAPQADQVVFRVAVDSGLGATRDDVAAAVRDAGITLANFSSVQTVQQFDVAGQRPQNMLEWTFTLPVAIGSMKSTIAQLTALQQANAQKKNGLTISFGVAGTQVSPAAQQAQTCSVSDLLSDARAQAQKMATAAGVSLGTVLALASATVATDPTGGLFSSPGYYPVCTLTVKFALGAF